MAFSGTQLVRVRVVVCVKQVYDFTEFFALSRCPKTDRCGIVGVQRFSRLSHRLIKIAQFTEGIGVIRVFGNERNVGCFGTLEIAVPKSPTCLLNDYFAI